MSDRVTVKIGDKEYFYFKSELKVSEEFLKIDNTEEYCKALENYNLKEEVIINKNESPKESNNQKQK